MEELFYAVLDQDLNVIAALKAKGLDEAYWKAKELKPGTETVRHFLEGDLEAFLLSVKG